jgi:hypothetical protein
MGNARWQFVSSTINFSVRPGNSREHIIMDSGTVSLCASHQIGAIVSRARVRCCYSVPGLMAQAGFTHGAFYGQCGSWSWQMERMKVPLG